MPLSGAHIACGYVGGKSLPSARVALMNPPVWSQTMAAAGVTAQGAPVLNNADGDPCFEVRVSAAAYVSVGPNPDATNGPRLYVEPGEARNIFCKAGDKLAWVLA